MPNLPRLELTWIGKENRPRLEPRILLEDAAQSYHAPHRTGGADIFDNRLIFGDNLLALKALEQEFTGRVKCVYIDPPYNTGSAFEHYDDGIEHSIWLGLMRDRLALLHKLLSKDGSIWISIDDKVIDGAVPASQGQGGAALLPEKKSPIPAGSSAKLSAPQARPPLFPLGPDAAGLSRRASPRSPSPSPRRWPLRFPHRRILFRLTGGSPCCSIGFSPRCSNVYSTG